MPPEASAPGAVERLVRRDRVIVVIGLVVLCALAWLWVIRGAGMGMSALEMTRKGLFPHLGAASMQIQGAMPAPMPLSDGGAMTGASGWMDMAPEAGRTSDFLLVTSMWWVMMIAMMLPSAAPMMLLYAGTVRFAQRKGRMSAPPSTAFFLAGYLVVWLGFSFAAALLQHALVGMGALSGMMLWSTSPWLSASVLALAAVYQVMPLKQACLEHCRSPAHYLSRNWRDGAGGAFRMGVEHGAYCLGCCWVLMLLLFVGGVMNLLWIAALAVFVLVEKLGVPGLRSGVLSAAVLGTWAVATLLI
jgi:predicted metal-binding membrane protein